jgi:hypothetical protein
MKLSRLALAVLLVLFSLAMGCSAEPVGDTDQDVASCSSVTQVLLWSPSHPLKPITDDLTPNLKCTHYYVMLPLDVTDKTQFHGNVADEIARVHARGTNFHAVAEFNVTAWRRWIAKSPGTRSWHSAGVAFRNRMEAAGFKLFNGQSDTWMIQEMPTTLVTPKNGVDPKNVRQEMASLMRALHDGDGTVFPKKGGGMRAAHGQAMDGLTVSQIDWIMSSEKTDIEAWLEDDTFWSAASHSMRFWSEETYADPHVACQPGTNTAQRAASINEYTWHVPRLADEGGSKTAAARAFLHKAYMPLMSAAWMNDVGYGNTNVSLDNMKAHVSTEVYAVKAWFNQHDGYTGQRIGFAFVPSSTDASAVGDLGHRIARAIDDAYASGHGASYACSPSGAFTLCQCSVWNAKLVPEWGSVFATY